MQEGGKSLGGGKSLAGKQKQAGNKPNQGLVEVTAYMHDYDNTTAISLSDMFVFTI